MKNFLFDLYGTLLDIRTDEESGAFWEKVSKTLNRSKGGGGEIKNRYLSLCEREKANLPQGGEIDLAAVFSELLAENHMSCSPSDVSAFASKFRELSIRRLRPFRGTKKLLRELKSRGAGLYLLSNAQSCFTYAEIGACGLTPLFDGILLSSEAGFKKPSTKFFEAAFEKFSLDPDNCIYVGNDLNDDVGGAHAAHMQCVYIESPQSGKYSDPPEPDFIAKNRKELKRILLAQTV